jgi:hypothetical protein
MRIGKYISPYMRAEDLKAPKTLTIESTEIVSFKDQDNEGKPDRDCVLVKFVEVDVGVIAGKPALKQLVEILGTDETDNWISKKVVVFVDTGVQFKGKRMSGLRFRAAT